LEELGVTRGKIRCQFPTLRPLTDNVTKNLKYKWPLTYNANEKSQYDWSTVMGNSRATKVI
jgi:hypothetical protein